MELILEGRKQLEDSSMVNLKRRLSIRDQKDCALCNTEMSEFGDIDQTVSPAIVEGKMQWVHNECAEGYSIKHQG